MSKGIGSSFSNGGCEGQELHVVSPTQKAIRSEFLDLGKQTGIFTFFIVQFHISHFMTPFFTERLDSVSIGTTEPKND